MISDKNNKVYIAVLDAVPDHMVPVLVAHTILSLNDDFCDNLQYIAWKLMSYRKCVLRVNQREFDRIAQMEHVTIGRENKTLQAMDSCIACVPREDWPNVIKFAKTWAPVGL